LEIRFLEYSNDFKKIYLAFAIVALLAIVRYEGLLMIIPTSIVFFIRFRKQKKDLIKYIICISVFILILVPMAYLKNETMGQDGFISHVSAGPMYYQSSIQENSSALGDFLYLGSINLIKYLGWALIPSFLIFIPLGIILIFKSIDYKKITIILSILIMLIPAFYGYSREIQDTKYLYVLYPIFCVLACFTFKIFLEKFHRRNLIFCVIIGGIILSSMIFVEWKAMDNEHYRETYKIFTEIGQKEMKINKELGLYGGELTYFSWVVLQNVDEFPVSYFEKPSSKITWTPFGVKVVSKDSALRKEIEECCNPEIDNLRDYFQALEKQKITHLLLDESNNVPWLNDKLRLHLADIFNHENKYPFLVKEYDSKKNGYSYYVKLFEINYDLYNELINEN